LPAPGEALGDPHQRRKEGFRVRGVEARHHHRPLPPPALAVRREQAVEAELPRHAPEARGALEAVGTVAQDGADGFGIAYGEDLARADAEAEIRPVAAAPFLGDEVQAGGVDLQQIAEQRQAARPGQVPYAPRPGCANSGRVYAVFSATRNSAGPSLKPSQRAAKLRSGSLASRTALRVLSRPRCSTRNPARSTVPRSERGVKWIRWISWNCLP